MSALNEVMTVTEIEQCFGLAKNTVRQHMHRHGREMIERGNARKSVGTWLIRREAAEKIWGRGQRFEIVCEGWDTLDPVSRSEMWVMAHDWATQYGGQAIIRQSAVDGGFGDGVYTGDQQFAVEILTE